MLKDWTRKETVAREKEKEGAHMAAEALLMMMNTETRKDASTQTEAFPVLSEQKQARAYLHQLRHHLPLIQLLFSQYYVPLYVHAHRTCNTCRCD